MLASALLLVGLAVSVASGLLWRSSVRTHDRQTFDGSASGVTATLDTLLRRDADFVATLRATLTLQPHMSATRFDEWFDELQGQQRLVGSLGASVVERVPASALQSFQVRRNADPAFRALVGGAPERIALASRGYDCLLTAGVTVSGTLNKANTRATQGNWCSNSGIGVYESRFLQAQTDTGQLLVQSLNTQGRHLVIFQAAFYRRGASLATVAGRRAAVAGWILSTFDVPAAIQLALADHPGLGVALYHSNPGQGAEVIDQVGRGAAGAAYTRRDTVQIEGAWTVTVSGAGIAGGPSAGVQGLLVLALGALVTVLICALILVLARSRERALGMVHEKTGQLRHQALHDALTGLPNRVLALDRAQQMLARARRQQTAVAALYVDLDSFKHVNDTFGHAAGDELLRIVAARLMTIVREGDTAARLGGDEFVVLLESTLVDLAPELVAERLLEVLRQPYQLSDALGRQLSVTASVGIAVGPRLSADELLRDADLALYQAKASGRNRYSLFESSMQTASHERLTLEMDLAEALERQQLFLLYQPTFDLRSETVIGVEALIRWRHPTRGVIAPDRFIPIAEQCGLIVPIGRWVLEEACRQAAIWHGHGHRIGMSVNVSARQLDDDTLIDDVEPGAARERHGPGGAHARGHRDRADARPRSHRGAPALAQAARRAHLDRRLRHRLQLACLPAPVPRRRTEDRPLVHRRHRHLRGVCRVDPHARAARQGARHRDASRGHRRPAPAQDAAAPALRPRAGILSSHPLHVRRRRAVPRRCASSSAAPAAHR